jgi:probable HAF family extracellular repeat protein
MQRSRIRWTLAALFIALPVAAPAAPPQYLITPIDLPSGGGGGQSINNQGKVIGNLFDAPETSPRAYVYTPGVGIQFLPLLPGFERSYVGGINDAGDIVGTLEHQEPLGPPGGGMYTFTHHGFLYRNGSITDLGDPANNARHQAWDISDNGYITGTTQDSAYRRLGNAVSDLGQFQGLYTDARSINDAGDLVGYAPYVGGSHGFLYRDGAYTNLGTLGGAFVNPRRINNSGLIVGEATNAAGAHHAFLYADGVMRDILGENTGGQAMGINDLGQVVGVMDTGGVYGHGYLYENGTVTDLNTLIQSQAGWTVVNAIDINDRGQILAVLQNPQGVFGAAVLTPVPEPAGAAALGLVGVALLVRRRRG